MGVGDVMVCEPAQCGQTLTIVTFIKETSPMQRILGTIISIMFWYLFFSLCCACCCPSEEEAQVVVIRNAGPAPASGVNQQQAQPPVQEHIIDMPIGLPVEQAFIELSSDVRQSGSPRVRIDALEPTESEVAQA